MRGIIYRPKGAAAEYSLWGVNIYRGCSHKCEYCYNRRGVWAGTLGIDTPVLLKKAGCNEDAAVRHFSEELEKNREAIVKDGGLFFSFTTDPMLPQTLGATLSCLSCAIDNHVPVQILTKATEWCYDNDCLTKLYEGGGLVKVGFTLTGHDELEPGAPTNESRIDAMRYLAAARIKLFASIEPVIDFAASLNMIYAISDICPEIRIGLQSPYSPSRYDTKECERFIAEVSNIAQRHDIAVLYKESVTRFCKDNLNCIPISGKQKGIL